MKYSTSRVVLQHYPMLATNAGAKMNMAWVGYKCDKIFNTEECSSIPSSIPVKMNKNWKDFLPLNSWRECLPLWQNFRLKIKPDKMNEWNDVLFVEGGSIRIRRPESIRTPCHMDQISYTCSCPDMLPISSLSHQLTASEPFGGDQGWFLT